LWGVANQDGQCEVVHNKEDEGRNHEQLLGGHQVLELRTGGYSVPLCLTRSVLFLGLRYGHRAPGFDGRALYRYRINIWVNFIKRQLVDLRASDTVVAIDDWISAVGPRSDRQSADSRPCDRDHIFV